MATINMNLMYVFDKYDTVDSSRAFTSDLLGINNHSPSAHVCKSHTDRFNNKSSVYLAFAMLN